MAKPTRYAAPDLLAVLLLDPALVLHLILVLDLVVDLVLGVDLVMVVEEHLVVLAELLVVGVDIKVVLVDNKDFLNIKQLIFRLVI